MVRQIDPAIVYLVINGEFVACKTDDPHIFFGDRAVVRRPSGYSTATFDEVLNSGIEFGRHRNPDEDAAIGEIVGRVIEPPEARHEVLLSLPLGSSEAVFRTLPL